MRGRFFDQGGMFSYIQPERRIPANHPLRKVRELVREVLKELSPTFGQLYSHEGRPSIPPEQLLSALLLQVFYSIRSERQLIEQLDYNLLFRWFVGLSPDDPIWDATVFTKNRERLQEGDVLQKFMIKLLEHEKVKPLLSDEHFSVDGTLVEAWASHKSFKPKRTKNGDDGSNFHGQVRKNDTHQQHDRPRSQALPQGGRAGGQALLHGPCAHGEQEWPCRRRHRHRSERHGRTASFGSPAQEEGQGLKAHHRRRGQGLRRQRPRCGAAPHERHTAYCAKRQPHQDWQAA